MRSIVPRMMPADIAPTGPRVSERVVSMTRPGSASMMALSSGTNTSSQRTSAAVDSRCPILCSTRPTVNPGASCGMTKPAIVSRARAGSAHAVSTLYRAMLPFEMKTLRALTRYPPGTLLNREAMLARWMSWTSSTSLPPPGSVCASARRTALPLALSIARSRAPASRRFGCPETKGPGPGPARARRKRRTCRRLPTAISSAKSAVAHAPMLPPPKMRGMFMLRKP